MSPIRSGLHNHCTLCDGKFSARDMVEAALAAGFTDFGLSCHSGMCFDDYGLKDEDEYLRTVRALQQEYAGRIRVYCGLEQDYFAPTAYRSEYDYIIGSVHYLHDEKNDRYYAVDGPASLMEECLRNVFGGDARKMVSSYYDSLAHNADEMRPEIAGHIDVIGRNNVNMRFFDENAPWYLDIAYAAIDRIHASGAVFELNTNGWRKRGECYPAPPLLKHIRDIGGRMTLNADAHRIENVALLYDEGVERLRSLGFTEVQVWQRGGFVAVKI